MFCQPSAGAAVNVSSGGNLSDLLLARLSDRSPFSQRTFAETDGDDEDAPIVWKKSGSKYSGDSGRSGGSERPSPHIAGTGAGTGISLDQRG